MRSFARNVRVYGYPMPQIREGERFNRRKPIHERFGGSQYSGIALSNKGYVLAFTSPAGNDHGYVDGWSDDGLRYFYAGQGQIGDQTFDRSENNGRVNSGLRDHDSQGRQLVLFQGLKGRQYECMGEFVHLSHSMVDGYGTDGEPRKVIRFELLHVQGKGDEPEAEQLHVARILGYEGRIAYQVHRRRERDRTLAARARALHGSRPCSVCGVDFAELYGMPQGFGLDVHHIHPLSMRSSHDNTPTSLDDLIVLCCICHRALHRPNENGIFMTVDELRRNVSGPT